MSATTATVLNTRGLEFHGGDTHTHSHTIPTHTHTQTHSARLYQANVPVNLARTQPVYMPVLLMSHSH